MDRARFDELAETLGIAGAQLGTLETIRHGTLIAPRKEVSSPAEPAELHGGSTLPRLEVAPEGQAKGHADLELVSLLGRGGMGAVWLARQRSLDRVVAIKRLGGDAWSASNAAALLAEARATGALEHPSIVPVHALGVDADGSPLLVMKRVEGATLEALIRDRAHPAWPDLLRRHGDRIGAFVEILMRVADALHFAHARGLVHRDVKPENVMVGAFGETYLLDWGVAARTGDGAGRGEIAIVGTPCFMAPEMVRGEIEAVDARTDVYLLGATLHACLTGTPRHEGAHLAGVLLAALLSDPVRYASEVPAELAALANRATAADPAARPASALAMREALGDFVRHRASLRLAQRATEVLDAIAADGDERRARELSEARFGFVQAVREWDGNELARAGLRRTSRELAEIELRRRNPDGAAAMARELDPRDPELDGRIETLRAEIAEARRLEEAARAEARDRDPRIGGGTRMGVAALMLTTMIVVSAYVGHQLLDGPGFLTIHAALAMDTGMLVLFGGTFWVLRRRLFTNRWGRDAIFYATSLLLMAVTSSVLTLLRGGTIEEDAPYRMLGFSVAFALGTRWMSRWLALAAAAMLVGAVVGTISPLWAVPIQIVGSVLAVSTLIVESRARRAEARPEGTSASGPA